MIANDVDSFLMKLDGTITSTHRTSMFVGLATLAAFFGSVFRFLYAEAIYHVNCKCH